MLLSLLYRIAAITTSLMGLGFPLCTMADPAASQPLPKKEFIFNVTYNNMNRKVFIRDDDQRYICRQPGGWAKGHGTLLKERINNHTLQFRADTKVGIYQLRCGEHKIVVEIIDSKMLDVRLEPPFPDMMRQGESYIFRVLLQPFSIYDDETFYWDVVQYSAFEPLDITKEYNYLLINVNRSVPLGEYSVGLRLDCKTKKMKFKIEKELPKVRVKLEYNSNLDVIDSISGFYKFFITFIVFGTLILLFSISVYVCAFMWSRRSKNAEISGHKNVIEEENNLLDDHTRLCYKVMDNPMSREKDVELILEKAREIQTNLTAIVPYSQCGMPPSFELSPYLLKNNPYGISQDAIDKLKTKFPKGVCLNCVKLASQLILLNKADCPTIQHICQDETALNSGINYRCICAEMQLSEAARETYNLYHGTTTRQECCQIQNCNNNNICPVDTEDNQRDDQKVLALKVGSIDEGFINIDCPGSVEVEGFPKSEVGTMKDARNLILKIVKIMGGLCNKLIGGGEVRRKGLKCE